MAAQPGAVPAVMPALTQFQLFVHRDSNILPAILAAAAMPALTYLLFDGFYGGNEVYSEDLDCISCLTALETLHLRAVDVRSSTLHLGALPRLLSVDLEHVTLEPGGTLFLRGGSVLQTLALDYIELQRDDDGMLAAVQVLPCLRRLSLYADDMVGVKHQFGRLLYLARLQSTLEARGCQIKVIEERLELELELET